MLSVRTQKNVRVAANITLKGNNASSASKNPKKKQRKLKAKVKGENASFVAKQQMNIFSAVTATTNTRTSHCY